MTVPELYFSIPDTLSTANLQDLVSCLDWTGVRALRVPDTLDLPKSAYSDLLTALHTRDIALIMMTEKRDIPAPFRTIIDGLHTTTLPDLAFWRQSVDEHMQIGCSCHNRDDAMSAGDIGADYVSFPCHETEILRWWNSVVELPSVAETVTNPEHARNAIEAGADFLNLHLTLDGSDNTRFQPLIQALFRSSD